MARRDATSASLRGAHVLLLCDDAERLALFKQALEYAGALTTACASVDEAHAVTERLRANVVVVQLRATGEHSRFIAALRALPMDRGGAIPALVLTGSAADAESLLAAGFHRHLTMPVHAAELCRALATLAGLPAAWPRL